MLNLGDMENRYRREYLEGDKARSALSVIVFLIANISLLGVDYLLYQDRQGLFVWMAWYRGGFTAVTALFLFFIHRASSIKNFDALAFVWLFLLAIYLILFNFTRPADYLTTAFDIMFALGVYLLSPLPFKYTLAIAASFSISVLMVDCLYKEPLNFQLFVAIAAQIISHLLGLPAALQIESYRRRAFKFFTEEKEAREMANYLVRTDTLTRSHSRQYLLSLVEIEFYRFMRYKHPLSILYMDIDHFKKINDRHGHHVGDEALRAFTKVVLNEKRAQDALGRLGGEEFALLLPETDLAGAKLMAQRIQKAWADTPIEVDDHFIHSTVSIGAVTASEEDKSFEKLLHRADALMYKAKRRGRNRVAIK